MTGRLIVTPFNTDTLLNSPLVVKDELVTSYNLPPKDFLSIIIAEHEQLELRKAYWGYTPPWLKQLDKSPYLARCESLQEKTMFRDSLQKRCLVPVSGYYEWKQFTRQKQAYAVRRAENRIFFLAGIWIRYPTSDYTFYDTFALLTTPSNRFINNVSERMPVIIPKEQSQDWLTDTEERANELLKPMPEDYLDYYPVSPLVNNPANSSRVVAEASGKRFRFQS